MVSKYWLIEQAVSPHLIDRIQKERIGNCIMNRLEIQGKGVMKYVIYSRLSKSC